MRPRRLALLLAVPSLVLGLTACGSDDGADVRAVASGAAASGSAGTGSGTGSTGTGSTGGSGSGLANEDLGGSTEDQKINAAVEQYRTWLRAETDQLVADTKVFTDAVRAGDLETAKAEFAPSRVHWESIEPIAGLIEDIDVAVDARVDDFESPQDPTWTGWHRIEYLLWVDEDTRGARKFADQLDDDIAGLRQQMATLVVPPKAMALGAAELVEEVSGGKITGEEDRYSKTDLWDFAANIDGSRKIVELLTPVLSERDPTLLAQIEEQFAAVDADLAPYEQGDGYQPYTELTASDRQKMSADLGALAESLARLPGVLGLG